MKKMLVTLFSVAILAGCSSTDEGQLARNDGYKCEKVKTLGSNIPTKYCSTKKQRSEAERNGKDAIRNTLRQGVLSGDTGK